MTEELNTAARNFAAEFIAESFKDGAKWALSTQWHIIEKDGYPQCDDDVIVAYESLDTETIAYGIANYDYGQWYTEDDNILKPTIFAWMAIPNIPEIIK